MRERLQKCKQAVVVVAVLLAAGAARADGSRGPAPHRHVGFFIRPEMGVGYLSTGGASGGVDAQLAGPAGGLGVAIGAALAENLILSERRQLLLPVGDNYSCRSQPGS